MPCYINLVCIQIQCYMVVSKFVYINKYITIKKLITPSPWFSLLPSCSFLPLPSLLNYYQIINTVQENNAYQIPTVHGDVMIWKHFPDYLPLWGESTSHPMMVHCFDVFRLLAWASHWTNSLPVIWEAMLFMWCKCKCDSKADWYLVGVHLYAQMKTYVSIFRI